MAPPSADPGSLQNLHDIVLPDAVPLFPPAPGWYAVFGVLFVLSLLLGVHWLRRYRAARYRREALALLTQIEARDDRVAVLAEVAALLKRVALAAYPRTRVASLSGDAWRRFLCETAPRVELTAEIQGLVGDALFSRGERAQPSEAELRSVVRAARAWIRSHDPQRSAPR